MKRIILSLFAIGAVLSAIPAQAADLMVASTMQRCTANEECQLVTNSCADNCGFVPVNRASLPALEQLYQTRCGKPMAANPTCTMNPPIAAACINSRCTIDYAYAHNAGPKDYQSGAYGVPPAAAPNKVPGDYSNVNDRHGFTAYDLPSTDVRQDTVGQIVTKVYVPPSAPVSGGNYVPVDATNTGTVPATPPAPAAAPAPYAAPSVPAPAVAPTYVPAPAPPQAAAPTYVPAPPPAAIPPAAVPGTTSYATPPVMTPSVPNQVPPAPPQFVPSDTVPSLPAPGLPAAPVAPPVAGDPIPAIPSVGASGVPQAPANAVPIPPSDLKPAPTFVPPPGVASPVQPEDPGAPPPAGSVLIAPDAKGTMGITTTTTTGAPAPATEDKKSFSGAASKAKSYN